MECLEQFIDNNSTTHDVQALNTLACCSVDGDLKLSGCPKHIGWVVEKHKHWENHFNLWWWWCASTAAAAGIPVQRHQTMNQHPCRVHHFLVADMLGEIGEVAVGYNNQSINLSLLLQKKNTHPIDPITSSADSSLHSLKHSTSRRLDAFFTHQRQKRLMIVEEDSWKSAADRLCRSTLTRLMWMMSLVLQYCRLIFDRRLSGKAVSIFAAACLSCRKEKKILLK